MVKRGAPAAAPREVAIERQTSPTAAVAIAADAVVCLVCGGAYRQLTGLHLRAHGLDADEYRRRFDLDPGQPLACLTLQQRLREVAFAREEAGRARRRARLMAASGAPVVARHRELRDASMAAGRSRPGDVADVSV